MALVWNPTTNKYESDLNAQGVSASAPPAASTNPWTAPANTPTAPMNPSANVSPNVLATGPGGAGNPATPPPATTNKPLAPSVPPPPGTGSSTIGVTGAGGTGSVTTGSGGTTGTAPSVPLGPTVTNPLDTAMRRRVLELLNQNPNAASITDPDLAPQAQAYAAARERARRQQQNAASERLGALGAGSSGAADLAERQGFETAGQDVAANEANLVGQKLKDRQQQLTQAIQVASSLGMSEEANNLSRQLAGLTAQISTMQLAATVQGQHLQERLANLDANTRLTLGNLDAQLRREGYSTTERLARMDTELRRYGIDVQGNLGLLNSIISLLGMDQQNTQFNQNLGATLGMFGTNFNWQSILPYLNP